MASGSAALLEDRPPAPMAGSAAVEKPARRLWNHALMLAALLAVLVPALDRGALISADEGAVLAQLEVLDSSGSWAMPNPLPTVDPDGRWFGLERSETNGTDFFPYAKHAVYPAVLRPLYAVGGDLAVVFASALGTWAAAVLAALLARRLERGLDVATLWVVGVASPLFFDAFWAIAHSIGAAFATAAVLGAVRAGEDRRLRWIAGVGIGVVGAAWFRSEGVLFGLALGAAVGAVAVVPAIDALRHRRGLADAWARVDRWSVAAAAGAGTAALVARVTDARWSSNIMGTTVAPYRVANRDESWLGGRLEGAWATLLRPQLSMPSPAWLLLMAMAMLVVVAAVYARRRPSETGVIGGAALGAAACAVVAVALPKAPVPGLLVAFPLLPVGSVVMRSTALRVRAAAVPVVAFATFAGAVLLTQYSVGGSMEWGGRYFHLGLPAVVPALLAAVRAAHARLDPSLARRVTVSAGAIAAALVVIAVGSVVRLQGMARPLVAEVVAAADATVDADDPGGPVVVTNMVATARFAWEHAVHSRYLTVPESRDLPVVASGLAAAGVEEFVLASYERHDDVAQLRGYEPVDGRTVDVGRWKLFVMRRTEGAGQT